MPRSRPSVVTLGLIALMVLVFAWQLTLNGHKDSGTFPGISTRDEKSEAYGPEPFLLTHFGAECGIGAKNDGQVASACWENGKDPLSAGQLWIDRDAWPLSIGFGMFMHGGIWALIFSALFLWIFGPGVEAAMGRIGFLAFYLAAGVFTAFAQSLLDPDSAVPVISAAGAVGAVIGAHLALYPRARVVSLLLIPLTMTATEILTVWIAAAWLGFQLLPGVGGVATPATLGPAVIYLAPFAGFIFGAALAAILASRIRDPDVAALAV